MNRAQRRRAQAMARHNRFYETYVKYLPRVALDAPLERGRVYHVVYFHDDWCRIYGGGECNCAPTLEHYVEPVRS
jgi:hypothetical protein